MEEIKKDEKTETKKGKMSKGKQDKVLPQIVSFDAYFRMLMSKDISVRPHHKAPMKNWLMSKGLESATIDEFKEVLKRY